MMRAGRAPSTGALLSLLAITCSAPARPPATVVLASGADLESGNPLVTVHPLSRQIQRYALFVTLARYDQSLNAVPYFARTWAWSADRRTLELTLHTGLRWHDGAAVSAHDVVFTIDAARDPATGYPRYADLARISAVSAKSDSTVTIDFASFQPRFPLVLCELPIVPAHLLRSTRRSAMRQAPFSTNPVGNGPYRFVSRTSGQRWIFERNSEFPTSLGGPPRLRRLIVAVVDEAATKFSGLVSGELDMAGIAPNMASLVKRDPYLRVLDYPVLFASGVVFNGGRKPFDDERVRRAIALSIDRQRVIDVALAGYGTPALGPVRPDHPYALPTGPVTGRDIVLADSLLDAAGWLRGKDGGRSRDGLPLTFALLTVGSADNSVEQLIQSDMSARGIRMEIQQRELGSFLALARSERKAFDALFTGIPGDVSLSYLAAMFDSELSGGALDYAGFHSAKLDALLREARTARTDDEARKAWHEVQRYLAQASPVAWVYHARGVQGLSRRLRGVTMDLRGELVSVTRWTTDSGAAGKETVP